MACPASSRRGSCAPSSTPTRRKTQRVWVDAGDGRERHVWCGAFNFPAGDVVPLATLGTEMPDGRVIAKRGILGIDSEGMLCSARELGLGDDHAGILVLPPDSPLGVPYGDVTGLREDVVIDVDVTRNRPDCWSYVGVARDLAAKLGLAFTPPVAAAAGRPRTATRRARPSRSSTATAAAASRRPCCRASPSVRRRRGWPSASPRPGCARSTTSSTSATTSCSSSASRTTPTTWRRSAATGSASARARDGEEIVTLDDVTRRLAPTDLLICDALDVPIGIGGIMGGADTEISDATTAVALEIAWFEPVGIGQSVARLGLRSEASARNERGVDGWQIDTSIARFVELLAETCPDLAVQAGAVDARGAALPPRERSCEVRISEVNRIIGTALTADDLPPLLDPIGYTVSGHGRHPHRRPADVARRQQRRDRRHRGGRPACTGTTASARSCRRRRCTAGCRCAQQRRRRLRDVLLGLGITEAMPNPFLAPDTLARAGLDGDALRITNPLVAEESVLRTSLRPGLLRAIAFNESHRRSGVALFEIGHVYPPGPGELPAEHEALGIVLAGEEAPAAVAVWREIAAALGVGARIDQGRVPAGLHATRSATLVAGRDAIGAVGEVAPEVLEAFDIAERVAVLELDLDPVLGQEPKPPAWKPTSRHPSSDLDLAFALPDDVPAEKLDKAIRQGAGALLVDLALFDVYRGPGVGEGRRSLAYRLRLQAADRNLTDADVADVRTKVTASTSKLGAELRS